MAEPGAKAGGGRIGRMSDRAHPLPRAHFPQLQAITTRWMDNDVYGHVNNVVHYSFFDTAVNRWLIEAGALDIHAGGVIGLVVQTQCHYFESLAFPQTVHAGLRVARLGRSSVTYELGLFADDAALAAAVGRFVHVYVDRATRRPVALPEKLRAALAPLLVNPQESA
jgi:acyl-CoA thioester hydrolase